MKIKTNNCVYSSEELNQIKGGSKWVVIESTRSKMEWIAPDGTVRWGIRTQEQKYYDNGSPYNPPQIRADQ